MKSQVFRFNNFDLLRLIAALQVAAYHVVSILEVDPPAFIKSILYFSFMFPGVPIFFFISGFLISKSYESNHKLSEYFQNRVLRLFPALIICVTFSFVLIFSSGYMMSAKAGFFDWGALYLAKVSILQFYNPDFMRAYGDGVLNGSLWTITVEIQFYILVPIIYSLFKLRDSEKFNYIIITLILFFLLINRLYTYIPEEYHNQVAYKLMRVSFLPWFYMFLFGIFVQKNFEFFHEVLAGKIFLIFILYCGVGYYALTHNIALGNNINPVIFVLLALLGFTFAYSYTGISKLVLRGNDISYGAYIYHMPVINFMLYVGFSGYILNAVYAFVATIFLALISWVFIEKKSLKLKRHPLNPLNN